MSAIFQLIYVLLWLYMIVLLVRLVLDWVQVFSRDWRPSGVLLVVANVVYALTDPPLRALRRVIRPIRIGPVSLDLAFLVLFLAVSLLQQLTWTLAAAT